MRLATRGFSLIELIAVLVILGALAVFVAPRLNIGGFDAYSFRQEALAGLRYARTTAAASGCPVTAQISPGSDSISLTYPACDPFGSASYGAAPVRNPAGGGNYVIQGADGVLSGSNTTLTFDRFGAPDAGAVLLLNGADDITVEPRTGYIR